MIQASRIRALNDRPVAAGHYVLYWMQQSQRTHANHALEYAVERANDLRVPVVVVFGLTDRYPEANLRHYAFLLQGLRDVRQSLEARGIRFVIRRGAPDCVALDAAGQASLVVTDHGYLRIQREWRGSVARQATCPVIRVESDAIVPVDEASGKEEYAAATLRPRIHRLLPAYLAPLGEDDPRLPSLALDLDPGEDIDDVAAALARLTVDRRVPRVDDAVGGETEALARLRKFIENCLADYAMRRSDPAADYGSGLSPYLHFGHISALHMALAVRKADAPAEAKQAFLEELIVRRELSLNFALYNVRYDEPEGLPAWARETLRRHANDPRDYLYSSDEWEAAATHDPYWNAAQREMVFTGRMHNYMRMYWGKKLLEWSATPDEAFRTALYLNNRYALDGRDPNSYAGVAWCFGKHDRPWAERAVFGMVRYMNAAGLRRKFDIAAYVRRIDALDREHAPNTMPLRAGLFAAPED